MPTYLGYVGQPGVGGPVPYAFQNMPMGGGMMGPAQPSQLGQHSTLPSSDSASTVGASPDELAAAAPPSTGPASTAATNAAATATATATATAPTQATTPTLPAAAPRAFVRTYSNPNVPFQPAHPHAHAMGHMVAKPGQWSGMGIGMPPVRQPLQRLA